MARAGVPTVSVVVPAYNHGRYLGETIASALGQTWRDLEVIVVDDGSTDDTPQVAAHFGDAIQYIRQANRGMAATRNTGIRAARGEFISFLDDDDLWESEYLSTAIPVLQKAREIAACHTGSQIISSDGTRLPQRSTRVVPAERMHDILLEGGFFPPSTVSVRRACLDQVGLFDERLQGCADLELWLRISRLSKFVGLPDVLVLYRVHGGGLSSNVQHMFTDHQKMLAKHFGRDEGDHEAWPEDKRRAYGFCYRVGAIGCLQCGQEDAGWQLMREAAAIYPQLLQRLDTFYELACGHQPRGYRGQASLLDLHASGSETLSRLEKLFVEASPAVADLRPAAYGNAYLALGMLSDQAGDWPAARRYLLQAARHNHKLVSGSFLRRLAKVTAGKGTVNLLRRLGASFSERAAAPHGGVD